MNYTVTKNNKVATIKIEDAWKAYEESVLKELSKEAEVPGFRKGSAPHEILKNKFRETVGSRLLDSVISTNYPIILKEEKLDVLSQPVLVKADLKGEMIELELKVDLFPEVKLPKYKGLKIKSNHVEVDKEYLEKTIEYILNKHITYKNVKRAVKHGDIAVIDFEGYINNLPFDGGKAENYELKIGSNSFIDNFETQLIGHVAGEEFDVNVTFPKNYQVEEFKGKDAKFKIKLKVVKEIVSISNDEIAKKEGFSSYDEFESFISSKLLQRRKMDEEERVFNSIIEAIASKVEIEIPDLLIENEMTERKAKFKQDRQRALTVEEEKLLLENVKAELKEMLVIRTILMQENIFVTQEDIEKDLKENFNIPLEQVQGNERFLREVESNVRVSKLKEFLIKNNVETKDE